MTEWPENVESGEAFAAEAGEVLTLVEAFLGALCDPNGGEMLYGLHADDAPVRHGEGVGRAADVKPDEFARRHKDLNLEGGGRLPYFAHPVLQCVTHESNTMESIAWFDVTEVREQRHLVVALGVRRISDALRIVWCTVADSRVRWSFRDGLLQALADYPWMQSSHSPVPRTLLDAGYMRSHPSEVEFNALPDARFSCQLSTACCKHDFEIALPADAQLLIDQIPWQRVEPRLAGTRLAPRADGKLQLKQVNETCRFLHASGQCLIHRTLGRQPFGPCCVFPFSFAYTPDGIDVGLSPVCGSVRLGLGVRPRERVQDLRERLVHAVPRATNTYRLAPGAEISWERFRDIERGLCDCLAAGELPVRRRLYIGARMLGALKANEAILLESWLVESPESISAELREAIHGMLGRIIGWDRAALRSLPRHIPSDLSALEVREASILTQILRNTLYCKVYSYPFDLTTAYNYVIVLYLLTLIMQEASMPVSDVMWRELGSIGVHGLLKSMLHEGMPEGFRTLLGTAEFGLWMLAA